MRLNYLKATIRNIQTGTLVIFVPEEKTFFNLELERVNTIFKDVAKIAESEKFRGKKDELLSLLEDDRKTSRRIILAGVGVSSDISLERFRRSAAMAAKAAREHHSDRIAFMMPQFVSSLSKSGISGAIAEGSLLSLYSFDKYFTDKEKNKTKVAGITLFDANDDAAVEIKKVLTETRIVCEAVKLARDLSNAPSNEIFPESLAEVARKSAERNRYQAVIWDKKKIEKEEFGGLLAVNSGSGKPPRFIILEHNGGKEGLGTIVLIGKGVTFDSGGISLKPATGMSEMKMDMSGAAAVIGTMEASARLKLPVHLIGLIPATENMPGSSALKPGDIVKHFGGVTSEVDNTDAEGRLILADAIAYAARFKPDAVIDLATLTGACVVALGQHATGMMGNDEELMLKLKTAGEKTHERLWQLPLFEEYEKQIKSEIADVKNVGGKWAGAITAALFLKKFIPKKEKYKWVHLDIAGTAMLEDNHPYAPKGGSGVGVRLLVEFLKNWR